MVSHGGSWNGDEASASTGPVGGNPEAGERVAAGPGRRDPDATEPGGGGDARPISLLGLRLTEPQAPHNALVTRRPARSRPGGTRSEPATGRTGGPSGGRGSTAAPPPTPVPPAPPPAPLLPPPAPLLPPGRSAPPVGLPLTAPPGPSSAWPGASLTVSGGAGWTPDLAAATSAAGPPDPDPTGPDPYPVDPYPTPPDPPPGAPPPPAVSPPLPAVPPPGETWENIAVLVPAAGQPVNLPDGTPVVPVSRAATAPPPDGSPGAGPVSGRLPPSAAADPGWPVPEAWPDADSLGGPTVGRQAVETPGLEPAWSIPVPANLPARRSGLAPSLPVRAAVAAVTPSGGRAVVPAVAGTGGSSVARARAGGRRVLVGGFGGGGGRTTVAAGLGLAIAEHHGHRVMAVDASPDQSGLLAHRVGLMSPGVGLRELATARPPVSSLEDVRRFVASDGSGGLEVLAGLRDLTGPGLLPEELAWALDLLGHWYPVVVADAPPGWSQPVPATLLARADLVVLTIRAGETEIAGADDALSALTAAGRPDLAATVIVAVVETYPSRLSRGARLRLEHLEDRAYMTVPVPFDAALADSRPISWYRLRRRTRFAFQRLAGAVATAPLPGSQPATVLARPAIAAPGRGPQPWPGPVRAMVNATDPIRYRPAAPPGP
ncbi:ATPases involved in chromosome partitioning-like [Frankia casuarinae]|uniref:ATPases involved in chromosome partitioning-like n=2 Tax=Frankia casuarinae (strain DSM 45818 / CECT 9043 / HFP020203 / CcI3) TaxID=106370 RepID=Q2J851_FRACC|nr:ATPases involved in chromosome partitioning-like [Frankia casuarinae]